VRGERETNLSSIEQVGVWIKAEFWRNKPTVLCENEKESHQDGRGIKLRGKRGKKMKKIK